MSNQTILMLNTLAGFSEIGQHIYLALLDKFHGHGGGDGERRAFEEASRADQSFGRTVQYILHNYPGFQQGPHIAHLELFLAKRWINNFMEQHP